MKQLSKDDFLKPFERTIEKVDLTEDTFVYVMSPDALEWLQYIDVEYQPTDDQGKQRELTEAEKQEQTLNKLAKVAQCSIVDQDGNRLFTEADIPALKRKTFGVLNTIMEAVLKLNKFDVSQAKKDLATPSSI